MLDYIRTGKVPAGSSVVFWHTGGATALFAEKEILETCLSKKEYCAHDLPQYSLLPFTLNPSIQSK